MDTVLDIRSLSLKAERNTANPLPVRDISLSVRAGECLALVGESGSGKSLTAMAAMGLLPPGIFRQGGEIITGTAALIMQNPAGCFDPLFTVRHTFVETFRDAGCIARGEEAARMHHLLESVGFACSGDIRDKYPFELSGGMLHRVMIALALAREASLIIADEPISGLDLPGKVQILRLLKGLQRQQGFGLLYIDHDLGMASYIADSIAVMLQGKIVEYGTAAEVLQTPRHEYTRALWAAYRRTPAPVTAVNVFKPAGEECEEFAPVWTRSEFPADGALVKNSFSSAAFPGASHAACANGARVNEACVSGHSAAPLLECMDVCKSYVARSASGAAPQPVIQGLSFSLVEGESAAIVGHNGAGKSTLIRLLLGLEEPDSGSVRVMGQDVFPVKKRDVVWRKHIQAVFQDSRGAVNPRLTIREILTEPLAAHKQGGKAEQEERCRALLSMVGLLSSDAVKYPNQMSGGQLQRVCIARALALEPRLLVLDEALTDLDAIVQGQLLDLLEELKERLSIACLYVSHDLSSIFRLCNRVLVLHQGRFVDELSPVECASPDRHEAFTCLMDAAAVVHF